MRRARISGSVVAACLLIASAASAQTAVRRHDSHHARRPARSPSTAICPTRRGSTRRASTSGTRPTPATTPSRRSRTSAISTYDDQFLLRRLRVRRSEPVGDARAVRRPRQHRQRLQRLRRHHPRPAEQRPHRDLLRRHAAQHPVRRDHRRRVGRGFVAGLLLGLGDQDHRRSGWTLEIRIPFSSLRYRNVDPQTWGILLYRNYPRDRHYQFFSAQAAARRQLLHLPLEHPDRARASAGRRPPRRRAVRRARRRAREPRDELGIAARRTVACSRTPASTSSTRRTPTTRSTSRSSRTSRRSKSDTAQISANERFALFFPEKRPFFLEGVDLFQTPIQAVYTRTITAPVWGGRVDRQGRRRALHRPRRGRQRRRQRRSCRARTARRWRRRTSARRCSSRARSATSGCRSSGVLADAIASERDDGDGAQPRRRPGLSVAAVRQRRRVAGSGCYSDTQTPNRPDLADEWTGQSLSGHARRCCSGATARRTSTRSRHVPGHQQTAFAPTTASCRRSAIARRSGQRDGRFRPKGFLSRLRTFLNVDHQADRCRSARSAATCSPASAWTRAERLHAVPLRSTIRSAPGDVLIGRRQFGYIVQFSPSRRFAQIERRRHARAGDRFRQRAAGPRHRRSTSARR